MTGERASKGDVAAAGGQARSARQALAPVGVSLLTSLVVTWPLVARLATHVPLGTERELTVPMFSTWNLWWVADRLGHGLRGYLDAPIFYPNLGVTAFSEPMPLLGAASAPLWLVGAPPALIHNVVLLLVLTLNGLFAHRLARALGASTGAALLASVMTVALPMVANLMGVLPNVALFGVLWALEGLVRFGASGRGTWAAWAGIGTAVTFLTFQQYALFLAPILLVAGIVAADERHYAREALLRIGTAGVLTVMFVLAVALPSRPYVDTAESHRALDVVEALSARPGDYVTRPETALVGFPPSNERDTGGLFPGVVLTSLAVAGVVLARRDPRRRRWAWVLAGLAYYSFALSLGPDLRVFSALRSFVPGFDQIRSPYRAAALVQVVLPVLGALALDRVSSRLGGSGGDGGSAGGSGGGSAGGDRAPGRARAVRWGAVAVIGLALLAAVENLSAPMRLERLPRADQAAWATWLEDQPDRTVLAHIPYPEASHVSDYEIETRRMLAQIEHGKPIVNGYSGLFPLARGAQGEPVDTYLPFQLAMAFEFPNDLLMCVLTHGLGADTLVVDQDWAADNERELAAYASFLDLQYEDGDVAIYALDVPEQHCD